MINLQKTPSLKVNLTKSEYQCKGHAEKTDCDQCPYFAECIKEV